MKLVEKHLIKPSKREWKQIDNLCFLSKNLYNCGVYQCRQAVFSGKPVPSFNELYHLLKTGDDYQALPAKVSQLIIKQVAKSFKWKQRVNLGRKNNQKFTAIPHATFINQLIYKCQLAGIGVMTVGEAYTSKCSFLDLEPIKKQVNYLGKRIKRGLFKAANGRIYNCDQNGSLNVIRNAVGDSLFQGQPISRLVVSPVRIKPYKAMGSHIYLQK